MGVVSACAPNIPVGEVFSHEYLVRAIRTILVAPLIEDLEKNCIVLGAWGCGAFCNPPSVMADLFLDVLLNDKYIKLYKEIHFAIPAGDNADIFEDRIKSRLAKVDLTYANILVSPLSSGESLVAAVVPSKGTSKSRGKGKSGPFGGCYRCGGVHRAEHCYLPDDHPIVLQRAASSRPTPPSQMDKGAPKSGGKGGKLWQWIPVAAGAGMKGAAGQECDEDGAFGGSPPEAGLEFWEVAFVVILVLGIIYFLLLVVEKMLSVYKQNKMPEKGPKSKTATTQTPEMSIWVYPGGAVYHTRKPCRKLDRMEKRPLCMHCKEDEFLL